MSTNRPFKYKSKDAAESDKAFKDSLGPSFDALKASWDRKLLKSGFKDAEKPDQELRKPNLRTVRWLHRDAIREFFLQLDRYLETHQDIPPRTRVILEAYSAGMKLQGISKKARCGKSTVKDTIKKYKAIVLKSYY